MISSTPSPQLMGEQDLWKVAAFILALFVAVYNVIKLERISHERVVSEEPMKPIVVWIFCCFRLYFRMIIVLSSLGAFLMALATVVMAVQTFLVLIWIVILFVLAFGTSVVHQYVVEEAVERGILSAK